MLRNRPLLPFSHTLNIDPYENVYTVIRGSKHFTLLPPTEGWCLKGPYCKPCHGPVIQLNRTSVLHPCTRRAPLSARHICSLGHDVPIGPRPVACGHAAGPLVLCHRPHCTRSAALGSAPLACHGARRGNSVSSGRLVALRAPARVHGGGELLVRHGRQGDVMGMAQLLAGYRGAPTWKRH